MLVRVVSFFKETLFKKIDPVFLFFLLMVLNYRYSFKIIALIILYAYRPNFKFEKSRLNFFFIIMIIIGLVNLLISGDYRYNHIISVLLGCAIWLVCLLIAHQVKLFVQQNNQEKIVNTIKVIVVFNFVISLIDLTVVMTTVNSINPYTQFSPPPFGIMSGDLIGGMFGKAHLVNTCISSMCFVFFLYRKNFLFILLTVIPLLMTSSNIAIIIILCGLLFFTISSKDKVFKYYSIFSIAIIIAFYAKINPYNLYSTIGSVAPNTANKYFKDLEYEHFSDVDPEEVKEREIDSLLTAWHPTKKKTTNISNKQKVEEKKIIEIINSNNKEQQKEGLLKSWKAKDAFIKNRDLDKQFEYGKLKKFNIDSCPGVIISYSQTKDLLLSDWKTFLIGAGTNDFSSRLAFINSKMVSDSRIFEPIPKYESDLFKENHKAIFRYLQYTGEETHSIIHLPFSGYNQITGEYGIIGFIFYIILYLGAFGSRWKKLSYGTLLLILIIPLFAFEYWFERISVMVFFEFLMLLDLKFGQEKIE